MILLKKIQYFILFFLLSCRSATILPPKVIGIPAKNAYTGLIYLDQKEIRSYGKNHYIRSYDNGETWDTISVKDARLYGQKSPISHEYIRLLSGPKETTLAIRSQGGIDGTWHIDTIDTIGAIMLKPAIFVNQGKRVIVGFHSLHRTGCGTYYSDDDGITWQRSNSIKTPFHKAGGIHQSPRWNHGAVEPTIIELNDGRLWMLIRTSQDELYQSYSHDYGTTWQSATPSRFNSTITMPTLYRLSNKDILLLWCNTTPLPEQNPQSTGYWEDVFTNRDVIHVAISSDECKTWQGFRELYLNPLRNDSLMATRYGKMGSNDRSVQQSQCIELKQGELLVALGQHPKFRKLLRFNKEWIYEKKRSCHFSEGLKDWSVHLYKKGIKGHCAYHRIAGAKCVKSPTQASNVVMQLCEPIDTSLVISNAGALYNFPASSKGKLSMKIYLQKGFKGAKIHLHNRWFNPCDTTAYKFAPFTLDINETCSLKDKKIANLEKWTTLTFMWDTQGTKKECILTSSIQKTPWKLPLNVATPNGISYLHFLLSTATNYNQGLLIDDIEYQSLDPSFHPSIGGTFKETK
jgi:hypothetical protein